MERKIGEIFKYNGEWYQCVVAIDGCRECSFRAQYYCTRHSECFSDVRSDGISVLFKKLEKVGEPYRRWLSSFDYIIVQKYKLYDKNVIMPDKTCMYPNTVDNTIEIIEQTKEDMEEKKSMTEKFKEYISRVSEEQLEKDLELLKKFNESGVPVDEFIKSQETAQMKSFNLEAAKAGKTVCTRDGRKARIICFDRKFYHDGYNYPIVAMVNYYDNDNELVHAFTQDGLLVGNAECELDLMMLPEKKEGWVNVYRDCDGANITKDDNIYSSKDAAIGSAQVIDRDNYVATAIIKWEE